MVSKSVAHSPLCHMFMLYAYVSVYLSVVKAVNLFDIHYFFQMTNGQTDHVQVCWLMPLDVIDIKN